MCPSAAMRIVGKPYYLIALFLRMGSRRGGSMDVVFRCLRTPCVGVTEASALAVDMTQY